MGVHDTDTYPEIKMLLGIPVDEPIFILRSQDRLFRPMLNVYEGFYVTFTGIGTSEGDGMTTEQWQFAENVLDIAEEARQWQKTHATKIPD